MPSYAGGFKNPERQIPLMPLEMTWPSAENFPQKISQRRFERSFRSLCGALEQVQVVSPLSDQPLSSDPRIYDWVA
jgi:hypothetical protein